MDGTCGTALSLYLWATRPGYSLIGQMLFEKPHVAHLVFSWSSSGLLSDICHGRTVILFDDCKCECKFLCVTGIEQLQTSTYSIIHIIKCVAISTVQYQQARLPRHTLRVCCKTFVSQFDVALPQVLLDSVIWCIKYQFFHNTNQLS